MTRRQAVASSAIGRALDSLVATVAPGLALERARARAELALIGGYDIGRRSRRPHDNYRPHAGSASADTIGSLVDLRAASRDLYRNAPLATAAVRRVVTHAVGRGLRARPQIDHEALGLSDEAAEAWERQAARIFARHCKRDIDATGRHSFAMLQETALSSVLQSGDCLCAFRYVDRPGNDRLGAAIQLIEADRLASPSGQDDERRTEGGGRIVAGIEVDPHGRPRRYHVLADHPGSLISAGSRAGVWLEAEDARGERQVLHLMRAAERPDLYRGVPFLSPVVNALKDLSRYADSELTAAVVSSFFTVFVRSDGGDALPVAAGGARAGSSSTSAPANFAMGPGSILEIGKEDEIETANPGRPNANFEPFFMGFCQQIGAALEIPLELLLLRFQASYSASRAALLQAWLFFGNVQAWLVDALCQPVYAEVIGEAVMRGWLSAPGWGDARRRELWLGCQWLGPIMPQIDPVKEVTAAERRLDLGLTTREATTAELTGGDYRRNARQRQAEAAIERQVAAAAGAPDPKPDPKQGGSQ